MKTLFSFRLRVAWAIAGAVVVLGLGGCQNELSWDNDVHVPVLDDRLSWGDIVPDSLFQEGDPTEAVRFALQDTVDVVDWGAVLEIPDTTWAIQYGGEEEGLPEGFPILPGANFIAVTDVFEFNVDPSRGVELQFAEISSGAIEIEASHTLGLEMDMVYEFPHITLAGQPLLFEFNLPSAEGGVPGAAITTVDLSGAQFDFTQAVDSETGLNFDTNMLDITLVAVASEFANPNGYLVQASDSIRLELTFQSLVMEKLEGYFGNWELPMSLGVGLFDTIPLPEPVADFEGMELRLHMDNTMGADLRLYLDTIAFGDLLVEGDLMAGHDIPRAIWTTGVPETTPWSLDLASPTSTFVQSLETFPDTVSVKGRVELNPFDTSDLLMDRWDAQFLPTAWVELSVPVRVGANGLLFSESFDLDVLEEWPAFEGFLHLDFTHTFPIEVEAHVRAELWSGTVIQDTLLVPAGSVPNGTVGASTLSIPLNEENATTGGTMHVDFAINTFGAQPFTGLEYVRIQGRLEGTQTIVIDHGED